MITPQSSNHGNILLVACDIFHFAVLWMTPFRKLSLIMFGGLQVVHRLTSWNVLSFLLFVQNRELQIMRKLDHCNIVRLRYFFYSSGDKVSGSVLLLILPPCARLRFVLINSVWRCTAVWVRSIGRLVSSVAISSDSLQWADFATNKAELVKRYIDHFGSNE